MTFVIKINRQHSPTDSKKIIFEFEADYKLALLLYKAFFYCVYRQLIDLIKIKHFNHIVVVIKLSKIKNSTIEDNTNST